MRTTYFYKYYASHRGNASLHLLSIYQNMKAFFQQYYENHKDEMKASFKCYYEIHKDEMKAFFGITMSPIRK